MGRTKDTGRTYLPTADEFYGDTYNKKYYQTVMFDSSELSDIDEWEAGKEYTMVIKAKLKSKTMREDGVVEGNFQIVSTKEGGKDFYDEEQERYVNLMK